MLYNKNSKSFENNHFFGLVDEKISSFYQKNDESSTLDRHDRSVEASQEVLEETFQQKKQNEQKDPTTINKRPPIQKMNNEVKISNLLYSHIFNNFLT